MNSYLNFYVIFYNQKTEKNNLFSICLVSFDYITLELSYSFSISWINKELIKPLLISD